MAENHGRSRSRIPNDRNCLRNHRSRIRVATLGKLPLVRRAFEAHS